MILRRDHRADRLAVGEGEDRHFLARHELLDDDAAARLAKRLSLHDLIDGSESFRLRHGDDDALARCKSVRLDDDRCALRLDVGACGSGIGEHLVLRRRDAVLLHEVFGKRLRSFDFCRELRRAERPDARRRQIVNDAARKRRLRTDDDEIDAFFLGESDDRRVVRRRDLRHAFSDRRHAGVARNRVELFRPLALLELPRERMFASAAADDQNLHLVAPISQSAPKDMRRCARRRPTYDGTLHARVPCASCRARSRPRDSSRRPRT